MCALYVALCLTNLSFFLRVGRNWVSEYVSSITAFEVCSWMRPLSDIPCFKSTYICSVCFKALMIHTNARLFHRPVPIVSYKIHKILHQNPPSLCIWYRTYTASPSGRNQLLLSRDRELLLRRIARTRRIAFSGSRIRCHSFSSNACFPKRGWKAKRQKGKISEYWCAKWPRSLSISESIFFFALSSLARRSIYE